MPLALTTPYDPGDGEAGTYAHVKLKNLVLNISQGQGHFDVIYGNEVSGVFTEGAVQPFATKPMTHFIAGADMLTIISVPAASTSETVEDHVARALYQWLIDEGHFVGTIV